jgi:two-component system sensor histidine kinase HydH
MSAVLAHEIKNPLASLKGNAQLLAGMLPEGPETEKARGKAKRVVDEAVRLEKLTQDLLQFVRTGELAHTAVSPSAIVKDAAASIVVATGAEAAASAELKIDDTAAPATWSLDAGRMREVVVNLLDNATAAGPPVSARIAVERGRLVIEIRDGGPGVPPADREKVFEPFFTGKTRGTGLGLAIARRIVELHRGTIRVDDAPGGGALFRIEIPEA